MMTRDEIQAALTLIERISDTAIDRAIEQEDEISGTPYDHGEIRKLGPDGITVRLLDEWESGHADVEITTDELAMSKEEWAAHLIDVAEGARIDRQVKAQRRRDKEEEAERAEYERLRAKYEAETTTE
jgi:hypothetical protein